MPVSDPSQPNQKPAFVVSASGHASNPDDILRDLKALNATIDKIMSDADREIKEWEEGIKQRELAEKRRVAPGWLDSEVRVLEPAKRGDEKAKNVMDSIDHEEEGKKDGLGESLVDKVEREGEQMDKAFGGLDIK